jgi:hypothetical protein
VNYRLQILLGANIFALLAATSVRATELCVKCTGPDASYACVVGNTSNATLDTVSKFYCITSLAKTGSHASCAIDRNLNPPCPGERRVLPVPAFLDNNGDDTQQHDTTSVGLHRKDQQDQGAAISSLPPSSAENAGAPALHPAQNSEPGEAPPKTVEEMMSKSAKSAGDGLSQTQKSAGNAAKSASTALEKAGSAVGGAAKSSWKCLSSFFSNC